MESFAEVVRVLNTLAFGALTILALRQWRSRAQGGPSAAVFWLLATLGDLAVLSAIGVFYHPKEITDSIGPWVVKVIIVVLLLAPWLLYRFMAVFDPPSPRLERIVSGLTVAAGLATIALPRIPRSTEHPWWIMLYAWFVITQWSVTSLVVAQRLWRAGEGQPAVPRRRMRMLSLGSLALTVAALPGGVPVTSQPVGVRIVVQVLPLVAAMAFYLAFSPPTWLRVVWRWPDQRALRQAELGLMVGSSPRDVADQLLPHVTELLGGRSAFLSTVDAAGTEVVLAVHGMTEEKAREALAQFALLARRSVASFVDPDLLCMPVGAGWLGVRASRYAPYFGEDELSLLQALGGFSELVLQRLELFESERLARLDVERANNEMATLVYGVSHDLKSPLITVLGYLEYLRLDFADALGEEGRHYLSRMETSGLYMQDLISDLLELSRIGRIDTESAPVALGPLVADLAAEQRASHPAATLTVGALPVILANPSRTRQLFANLLENAIRHGGRDDITIRVTAEPSDHGGCRLIVADDGVGVPVAYHERVFGIFERLEPRQGDRDGTGIGLAICRKIVEQLDGHIEFAERPDQPAGTTVVVTLPAAALALPAVEWARALEHQS